MLNSIGNIFAFTSKTWLAGNGTHDTSDFKWWINSTLLMFRVIWSDRFYMRSVKWAVWCGGKCFFFIYKKHILVIDIQIKRYYFQNIYILRSKILWKWRGMVKGLGFRNYGGDNKLGRLLMPSMLSNYVYRMISRKTIFIETKYLSIF